MSDATTEMKRLMEADILRVNRSACVMPLIDMVCFWPPVNWYEQWLDVYDQKTNIRRHYEITEDAVNRWAKSNVFSKCI